MIDGSTKLCDCPGWPVDRFSEPFGLEVAQELAQQVHCLGHPRPCPQSCDPTIILTKLELGLKFNEFEGSTEALLIPRTQGSFTVIVDPRLGNRMQEALESNSVASTQELHRLVIKTRIAHELGHTFFYNWTPGVARQPVRLNRGYSWLTIDQEEELWCDFFAYCLLAPNLSEADSALLDLAVWHGRKRPD